MGCYPLPADAEVVIATERHESRNFHLPDPDSPADEPEPRCHTHRQGDRVGWKRVKAGYLTRSFDACKRCPDPRRQRGGVPKGTDSNAMRKRLLEIAQESDGGVLGD